MKQLLIGQKVEEEHKKTYNFIKRNVMKKGYLPSFKEFSKSIAKDHLKEDKNYYKKLKKLNL